MNIKGSRILILGGWGLVGSAICHKLIEHNPSQLIVTSLKKSEAEEAVQQLRQEYCDYNPGMFIAEWGNIFSRTDWRNEHWNSVISDENKRKIVISDIFGELNEDILKSSELYRLLTKYKPNIVIDCINTATGIAYQDIYTSSAKLINEINHGTTSNETVELMLVSDYIPQLIRHIQIYYRGLIDGSASMFLKIGTSGTGGMGLNIPYTHSEEKPSRVLLAKAAVGGAMSLLLFLMARTPNGPIVKEIKPTAAIAWKKIEYGTVNRSGKPIKLYDMAPEAARQLSGIFNFDDPAGIDELGTDLKSVFIDTGENGIFSAAEFQAISSLGQMEIVTPEEIADNAVFEILGGNSGHDIIQGLDSSTLGPSYRGGLLQNVALKKLRSLENQNNCNSIAFELLGPPRLSKLLYEAHLIRRIIGSMKNIFNYSADQLAEQAEIIIINDKQLRSEAVSIGLVILLKDGKTYLRGKEVKIPVNKGELLEINAENIENWCYSAWLDLRKTNFQKWKEILGKIIADAQTVPDFETSSRHSYNKDYWENFETMDEGKIVGWIFEFEEKGWRFKR
ncbi:MAG: short-chain dehydrogenase [Candidatus Kapabacteria bacterium]|nr:short-chain dehydrogenase [Candidatus Kapabacteria bacterium]